MYSSFKHLRVPSTYIEIMVTNIDINSNNNSSYLKYHMILKVERLEKLKRVHDGHGHFYTFL